MTYSMPILINDRPLNLTKEDFGVMASLQMGMYTIGKFLTGLLVDRYSNKRIFCFGLFCCGLTNVCFSVAVSKNYFFLITMLNGFFQAFGWNAIAVLINRWYEKSEVSLSIIPVN
jgi:Sugar phosphate permease